MGNQIELDAYALKEALDIVETYVYTKDTQGRYTFANRMVLNLFRLQLELVIGKTDDDFFDLSQSRDLRMNDRRVLDLGETITKEETNFVTAGGEVRVFLSVKTPIRDRAGNIVGLCGVSTDVTERKRLEGTIKEQHNMLNAIMESVDACVYIKDFDGKYLYVNGKTSDLFRMPRFAIVGTRDIDFLPKDTADRFAQVDRTVFNTRLRQAGAEEFIDELGKTRYYWTVKMLINYGGKEVLIGFSSDVTELEEKRKELHCKTIALQGAKDMLTSQNKVLSEAAELRERVQLIMQHDLKSPLSLIIGIPQLLIVDNNLTDEQKEFIRLIEETGFRMLNMINRSLDLFRMESGYYEFNPHPFNVFDILKSVMSELQTEISTKKIAVDIRLNGGVAPSGACVYVMVESLLTHSMFANLIKNAIEASQNEGNITILICVTKEVVVSITNAGEVPMQIRSTFFDKFITAGKLKGTGLGTYSAALIAKTQRGSLILDSSVDGETSIIARLPKHERIIT